MCIQAYMIGHAPFPLMRSVRDQNFRKIAVADGSIADTIALTTPCNITMVHKALQLRYVLHSAHLLNEWDCKKYEKGP